MIMIMFKRIIIIMILITNMVLIAKNHKHGVFLVPMKKMMLTLELGWSSIWVAVGQRVWTDTKSRPKVGATFLPSYQFTLPLAHPSFF